MELHNPTTHQKDGTIFISYYGLPEPKKEAFIHDIIFLKKLAEHKASKITVPLKEEYRQEFRQEIMWEACKDGPVSFDDFAQAFEKGISIESIKSRIKIKQCCPKGDQCPLYMGGKQCEETLVDFAILTPLSVEEERETQDKNMVDYILEIDAMTTVEFCEKFNVPVPYFTGEAQSSARQFLNIDAIKCKMFIQHAKKLIKRNK